MQMIASSVLFWVSSKIKMSSDTMIEEKQTSRKFVLSIVNNDKYDQSIT